MDDMKRYTSFFKKWLPLVVLCGVAVTASGCTIFREKKVSYGVKLEVWGTFDEGADYGNIFMAYHKMNPYVTDITFRRFSVEDYEKELLDALASGNGPDIFMINNARVLDFLNKMSPAPDGIVSQKTVHDQFPDVVAEDFVVEGKVYGLPLSVDSLALYYNKDIFNAAGITTPPKTWNDFADAVQKITQIDQFGNIVRSGAAMGTGENINRAADVITAMFLQVGVPMIDETTEGLADLSHHVSVKGQSVDAAENTLAFYTNFAAPSRSFYTWNRRQHYSLDAFTEGNTGMMINYSWHYNTIKRKNEKLNFAVAPLPQLSAESVGKNFGNYWGFAVASNTKPKIDENVGNTPVTNDMRVHEAWQFVTFLTTAHGQSFNLTNAVTKKSAAIPLAMDPAKEYLAVTKKPAARRDLIEEQKNDPILSPFASGNLIAQTWSRKHAPEIDGVLVAMIESVAVGEQSVTQALQTAQSRITQLLR